MGTVRTFGGAVDFAVAREVAFDYLVDPANRAQWQSSLRRVDDVAGQPAVGQTWTDVTVPGLQPAMRTTALDRPAHWAETGTWRFVRADLTLDLVELSPQSCRVTFRFRIHALGPLGWVASAVAAPAVGADLRRAAKICADSSSASS